MSEFKFSCPHCGQHFQCDERHSGKQIQCPTCQHLICIPPSPAQAARGDYSLESGRTWDTFLTPVQGGPPKLSLSEERPGQPPPQPAG